jgi:hypothetical protein
VKKKSFASGGNETNKQTKQKHHTKLIRSETQTTQNRDELSVSSSCSTSGTCPVPVLSILKMVMERVSSST